MFEEQYCLLLSIFLAFKPVEQSTSLLVFF